MIVRGNDWWSGLLELRDVPLKAGKPLSHEVALVSDVAVLLHQFHQSVGFFPASQPLAEVRNQLFVELMKSSS